MFAVLYRALRGIDINPRDADELELWEIAVLLGDGVEVKEDKATNRPTGVPPTTAVQFRERNLELIRARMRHERGEGPKPEVRSLSADAAAAFQGMMN